MSFIGKMKTKYTEISVHEDHSGTAPFYWASVSLAWADSAPPVAKIFATVMDDRLLELTRRHLENAVEDAVKDIYLEDADLLVNLKRSQKHQAAKLIGIIEKIEAEFDALTSEAKSK